MRYQVLIVAASLCILESLLILALVLNVIRRRRAEKELARAKTLADAVIEGLPAVFVLQDASGKSLRLNKNAQAMVGSSPDAVGTLRNTAIGPDLTGNKQSKEALRRSESELRSFIEHAPYGIGTISVSRDRFLRANPALVKLLGYKSEAEVLSLLVSRDLYPSGDSPGLRAQPPRADFFSALELTWKRKDGKPVNVRASGRRIPDPADQGDLIEIIAEDVTARRQLEEQLRHAQKLEALGQLSGSVAHDFNNLLSVIIGYSELLSANPNSEGSMRIHLEAIKRAGERAASLTAQLLAFSRRQELQPTVVNLNSLVRETEKMLQRLMGEDVEQKVILDPALWKTRADSGQMVQVIMNLAINARDAMAKGGTLTIETANIAFDEVVNLCGVDVPAGKYVKLSVSDTGTGMDAETLARIFEPFFTTKQAGKGTGLGLATVYGIVEQSGGYIFADSGPGMGAVFSIYLPQVDRSVETVPARPRPSTQGAETILIAEDEPAFRDLLRDGLQARGYQVLVASNGAEALRVAEEHNGPIRVLVTDVIMPQVSGPELARALRKVRSDIVVLYMSGYADDKLDDISSSGELTLLPKPFYIDELVRRIQEILARQNAEENRNTSPRSSQ